MFYKKYFNNNVFIIFLATILFFNIIFFGKNGNYKTYIFFGNFFSSLFSNFPDFNIYALSSDGKSIKQGDAIDGKSITFGVSLKSISAFPLKLQVELQKSNIAFSGVVKAESGIITLSKNGKVTIYNLLPENYHFRGRLFNNISKKYSNWKEFGSFSVVDSMSSTHEPVIIIPGISGTSLLKSSNGKELWPNVDEMVFSLSDNYLDGLILNNLGTDPQSSVKIGEVIKNISFSILNQSFFKKDFYGNLVDTFRNNGYIENKDFFLVPYDWRLGLENSVSVLDEKIKLAIARSLTGKINVVAHSMGGLLFKEYLWKYGNKNIFNKIVFAGVPQFGAPYVYKVLNYGDDLGVFVANRNEVKKIVQNMSAMYELLPSGKYINKAGAYIKDFTNGQSVFLNYDNSMISMLKNASDKRNYSLISNSASFHNSVDNLSLSGFNIFNIVGCGLPTISGFNFYDGGNIDIVRSDGDGTVPVASTIGDNNLKNYFVLGGQNGINHNGLISDNLLTGFIIKIISGTINNYLPNGISASYSQCSVANGINNNFIEFSSDKNVKIGITDSSKRYIGMDDAGKLSLNIPNSSYDEIGGNIFITVPASNNYKITGMSANGKTNFDMKIKEYAGTKIDKKISYFSIPIKNSTDRVELDFAGFNKDLGIKTYSASGAFQNIYYPDSTLSGYQVANDFIPPSVSVKKKVSVLKNSTFSTLLFNANDIGSGVSSISAVLNGISIKSGESLSFKDKGKNLLEIEAFDKAGNQSFKKINF